MGASHVQFRPSECDLRDREISQLNIFFDRVDLDVQRAQKNKANKNTESYRVSTFGGQALKG